MLEQIGWMVKLLISGGRVLNVTALGDTLESAIELVI